MSSLITRAGKGSPLTNDEMDANLVYLANKAARLGIGFRSESILAIDGHLKPYSKPKDKVTWNWLLVDTVTPLLPGAYQSPYLSIDSTYNGRNVLITYAYEFIPNDLEDTQILSDSIKLGFGRTFFDASQLSEKSILNFNKRIVSSYLVLDSSINNVNKGLTAQLILASNISEKKISKTLLDTGSMDSIAGHRIQLKKIFEEVGSLVSYSYRNIEPLLKSAGTLYDYKNLKAKRKPPDDILQLNDTVSFVLVTSGLGIITDAGYVYLTADSARDYGFITDTLTQTFDYGTLL
jgi:hypothetical protein